MSKQVRESQDRERRARAITRQREYAQALENLTSTSERISLLLDGYSEGTDPSVRRRPEPCGHRCPMHPGAGEDDVKGEEP